MAPAGSAFCSVLCSEELTCAQHSGFRRRNASQSEQQVGPHQPNFLR